MRIFTWVFTLFAVVLCYLHYFAYDPKNMLLFSFSVPLWFLPIFGDIRTLNLFVVYALTIAFYVVMGYIVDRLIQRYRQNRTG